MIRLVPFFRGLDRVDVARLIGALEAISAPAGTEIVAEGAEADGLYLLEEGMVRISVRTDSGGRPVAMVRAPGSFGELGLLVGRRTASVHAVTEVRVWKLPRLRFEQLVRERPGIGLAVAAAMAQLVDRRSRELVGAPLGELPTPALVTDARPAPPPRLWRWAGWIASLGVPVVLWSLAPPAGLSVDGWHVLAIIVGAALAWFFEPVPDFVVALLLAGAWGLTRLVPLPQVFAGFASSSWLVALSALGLAAAMTQSGLLFRCALLSMRAFAPTHAGQVLGLLAGGVVITPLVPLSIARIVAIAPVSLELSRAFGYPPRSRGGAALALAGLTGYGYFSSIFLTGLASNFFVLELLPAAERARFDWLTWLASAAPSGVLMLIGAAAVLLFLFRPERRVVVPGETLRQQQRVLGPLSRQERVTLAALVIFLLGLIAQPVLHVDAGWLAVASLTVTLAGGALDRDRFRGGIDWGFLILFGVLLGTGGVLQKAGIDRWIAAGLTTMTAGIRGPGTLLVLIALGVVIARLALPRFPAQFLLCLALVPAAPALGISPWLMGFVVLVVAHTWILPNQGLEYLITRDLTRGEAFTDRQGLIAGIALTVVRVAAIAASIPYWRALGLLTGR